VRPVKTTGEEMLFVTLTLSESFEPTSTVPKLSATGLSINGAAEVVPIRLTNSSEVAASDRISNVPERTLADEAVVGVNSTEKLQVEPGSIVEQLVEEVKSTGATVERICIVVVPVLVRVMVCAADASPICVLANVSALWVSE
jgi:hypothetical protein